MRVCIAQIGFRPKDIQTHVRTIKEIIRERASADLIVFPELILQGHPSFEKPEGFLYRKMKAAYSDVSREIYDFVKEEGAHVIIGEIRRRGERFYNLATYIGDGRVESYVKTHVHWTENFVPGGELKVFQTPLGKTGISICFDAAFPEMMRVLALKGAVVIVNIAAVPASFPVKYVWRRLQAVALNNQVFVIYCNRPETSFSGHSAVFDPRGEVIVAGGAGEELIEAELDLDEVQGWRDQEQIYQHMRPLLYRPIGRIHEALSETACSEETEVLRRSLSKRRLLAASASEDRSPILGASSKGKPA